MHSVVIASMLFSLASAEPPAGSVEGSVKVVQAGYALDCAGVWLIPQSAEIDAAMKQKFGQLDEGIQAASALSLPQARRDPPAGSLESRCHGRFSERFSFSEVPPGDYYLTMTAVPRVRYEDESKFGPQKLEMMQRVSVAPGGAVISDFKHSG